MDRGPRETDGSSQVQLITWLLFVVAVLGLCTRLGTKYGMTSKFSSDDWLMLAALAAYLAQCISISTAASNGLGKASISLTGQMIDGAIKAEYASVPFFILTSALVKLSIFIAINQLSPNALHRRLNLALGVVTALWYVPATLTSIFQCALPTPWDFINSTRCINRNAWWTFVTVFNVATDLGIVALHILILWHLHTLSSRKAVLVSVFSIRILVVAAAIVQLVTFYASFQSDDTTTALYLPVALKQAVLSLSITTACIPYLKPFMESLESGMVRVENVLGSEEELSRDRTGSSGYYLSSHTGRSNNTRESGARDG
ncbi:hypothetical protein GGR58DRAFT_468562 [Xylaria digitata]|nr:hypothetical protein GGR58DRAFT_468562 [Xylaria digitata]